VRWPTGSPGRGIPPQAACLGEAAGSAGRCRARRRAARGADPGADGRTGHQQPVGRCHVALRRLPGRQLARDEAGSPDLLAQLARLLDALGELGRRPEIGAAVPQADPGYWERFADDVGRVLFPLMPDSGRRLAAAELAAVRTVDLAGDALVHGDLGASNLLWAGPAPRFRFTGILDWDETHLGSQADDLASLATMLGWPAAERLDRRRHGGRCPTIADARIIETTFAVQQALPR
jgi:aminoglycoside phosphotransferase (APT) family kinase protein